MISVLMSVYNEKIDDIKKSIDSVLNQTYRNFEFIIVLDDPNFLDARVLLHEYELVDSRVKIIVNEKNIGLAMSMNKAADVAVGEYLLRMDADDISLPERFELEFQAIHQGNYDLVCTDYDFIDENDTLLNRATSVYTDKQIVKLLPHRNIIHHPTVLMKTDTFKKLGGYRNYQCAQDYDLWLRMQIDKCRFHMIDKKLLHYRVRTSSITVKHRYKQVCTLNYIHSLYHQFGKKKMHGYSYDGYLRYLEEQKVNDLVRQNDYTANALKYNNALRSIRKGKVFSGTFSVIKVLMFSKYFRPHLFRSLKVHLIKKIIK